MSKRRVVITGMGALCPVGNTVNTAWESLIAGKTGISRITKFDASAYACQIAGEVNGFDARQFLDIKEIKKHDAYSQYAISASQEAWDQAQLNNHSYQQSRMGCVLGVGIGGLSTLEKYHEVLLTSGPRKISPFLIPAMISNLGPGNIGIRYGLKGINYTITSACTSATHAVGEAYRYIASGLQDVVVTGGAEAAITPIGIGGFCAMKALSFRNDAPERASRPFDRDRDGFVMGEGAAVLILESLEGAQKRGAKILGEVLGYGFSCDAYHITAPSEDGAGAKNCMSAAIADATLKPQDIGYINAHGTSTPHNDVIESMAIKEVFGSWAKGGLLVSSTKSMTGHLLGAAGAIEAVFTVNTILTGVVPPTINLENPGEGCDLDYVPNKARKANLRYAISNSFGFGGTNASVVFGAYRE